MSSNRKFFGFGTGNAQPNGHMGAVGSSNLLSDEVVSEQLTRFAFFFSFTGGFVE
jgi:hypothetical protein